MYTASRCFIRFILSRPLPSFVRSLICTSCISGQFYLCTAWINWVIFALQDVYNSKQPSFIFRSATKATGKKKKQHQTCKIILFPEFQTLNSFLYVDTNTPATAIMQPKAKHAANMRWCMMHLYLLHLHRARILYTYHILCPSKQWKLFRHIKRFRHTIESVCIGCIVHHR